MDSFIKICSSLVNKFFSCETEKKEYFLIKFLKECFFTVAEKLLFYVLMQNVSLIYWLSILGFI